MSTTKDKVIVTGGCGFIGSHLVDQLIDLNLQVVVIDDLSAESNDKFYYNNAADYYEVDINSHLLPHEDIFRKAKWVFHLAAESRIGPAIKDPLKAAQNNIIGTVRMLEYSRMYGVSKFMYSSTSSVYGNMCELPTKENSPIDCLNPYSATKYSGEEMVKMYNKMYNLNAVIFRYFNVFGERSPHAGPYAPVIGIFQKQKNKNLPLTIVGDGEQRRDFVHVGDVAAANILAAQSDVDWGIFNIGSGSNISVNEIAEMISSNVTYIPERPGEARHTLAHIENAYNLLGYRPLTTIKDYLCL